MVFQPPTVVTAATGDVALSNTGTNSVLDISLSGSGATPANVTASPNGYSFGAVAMGSTVTENETLTNSDVNNVTISQVTVIGAGFGVVNLNLPLTLAPGQTTTFGVTFSPVALPGTDGAVALTVNGVSNAVYLGYSGSGGSTAVPAVVTPTPASLSFTNITTGQTSSQTVTLTNTGGVSTTISAATAAGTGYSVSGFTAGTLVPGATMSFSVTFAPTAVGSFPGTVTVTSNASNPSFSIPLTGTAVAPPAVLTASPTSLTYTNVTVGQSSSQTETIKNTGGTNATISAVAEAGAGFTCFRNHAAGDVDAGTEHDIHGKVCADQRYYVQWNCDGDVGRFEPELVDPAERDGRRGAGGSDGVADELDVHEHHGGAEFEPDGNDQEHGCHECDDFGGRGNGDWVQHFRDHAAGDVDGGTEHDVHGEVCADVRGHVPGNGDGDVERVEPEPGDSVERNSSDSGYSDGIAHEFDLYEHHGGADFEPDRNDQEHGWHERDNFGGRGIGSRVHQFPESRRR